MIEFYYKHNRHTFFKKSKALADELTKILKNEKIKIVNTDQLNISAEFVNILGKELFQIINDLYYTLRKNIDEKHFFLHKYLPEYKYEPTSELQFADFFCGAGGMSLGFTQKGFEAAFANDNYTSALETYYFNNSLSLNRLYNGDIKELINNFESYKPYFKNVKIILGGPPCQGFSNANRWNFELDKTKKTKRFIDDERNILYKHFVKLIGLIEPDFFIMENVPGMSKLENQIEDDIQIETDNSYYFLPLILNAKNFGIPQNRSRYFLIGMKDFMFLKQIKENIKSLISKNPIYNLEDALFGLPILKTNPRKFNTSYENEHHGYMIRKLNLEQNKYLKEINNNNNISYLFNHKSRYNNENDLEIYKLLPQGENSLHESIKNLNNYKNRNHIFKDKYYKLKLDNVSKTITSHMKHDCHMYIHPEQARGLSPREAARIQSFPDYYFFRGTLNDWYKQIGNAVPVKLSYIFANEIMKYYE